MQSLCLRSISDVLKSFVEYTRYPANAPFILMCYVAVEYARYLHSNLDNMFAFTNIERDFPADYRDHWLRNIPYEPQVGLH